MIKNTSYQWRKVTLSPLWLNKFHSSSLLCNVMENKPVENSIRTKLEANLDPIHLKVINESHKHNVPAGSETHFKVLVVSDKFQNMALLARHRLVNSVLDHELKNGVHALSIDAKTPSQWDPEEKVKPSPTCLGGFGK